MSVSERDPWQISQNLSTQNLQLNCNAVIYIIAYYNMQLVHTDNNV